MQVVRALTIHRVPNLDLQFFALDIEDGLAVGERYSALFENRWGTDFVGCNSVEFF